MKYFLLLWALPFMISATVTYSKNTGNARSIQNAAGGNCFYYSMTQFLHGDEHGYTQRWKVIKDKIMQEMTDPQSRQRYEEQFKNALTIYPILVTTRNRSDVQPNTYKEYVDLLAEEGTYADDRVVKAAAYAYKQPITVFSEIPNLFTKGSKHPEEKQEWNAPMMNVHLSNEHYMLIRGHENIFANNAVYIISKSKGDINGEYELFRRQARVFQSIFGDWIYHVPGLRRGDTQFYHWGLLLGSEAFSSKEVVGQQLKWEPITYVELQAYENATKVQTSGLSHEPSTCMLNNCKSCKKVPTKVTCADDFSSYDGYGIMHYKEKKKLFNKCKHIYSPWYRNSQSTVAGMLEWIFHHRSTIHGNMFYEREDYTQEGVLKPEVLNA